MDLVRNVEQDFMAPMVYRAHLAGQAYQVSQVQQAYLPVNAHQILMARIVLAQNVRQTLQVRLVRLPYLLAHA